MILLELTGQTTLREPQTFLMVIELMGKYSNVLLVDGSRRIQWVMKRVTPEMSRVRPIEPGSLYVPPPRKPWSLTDPQRFPSADVLKKHFPWIPPEVTDPSEWFQRYLAKAQEHPQPVVVSHRNRLHVLPMPVPGVPYLREFPTYSEALAFAYQEFKQEPKKPSVPPGILKEWQRVQAYEKYRFLAEEVMRRREELLTQGVLRTSWKGEEIRITLEEGETPEDLARRYAREAARLERGYRKLKALITQGDDRPAEPHLAPERGPKEPAKRYLVFTSPSGFKVLVGKNARGNDEITFRLASRDDYFFHVRNAPGAHVILKTGKAEPSEDDLFFAARKALEHSAKARDGKGLVSFTRVRYLRKPKGAPPGLVLLLKENTMEVRL